MQKKKTHMVRTIESLEPILLMSASPVDGTDGNDWISGTDSDNVISAGDGHDFIHAPLGDNRVDGGDGFDTFVVYEGTREDFAIERRQDGSLILEGPGLHGGPVTNELINVEQILFNDGPVQASEIAVSNAAPVANNDFLNLVADEELTGNLFSNDFDRDDNPFTASLLSGPRHGILEINSDGSFTYVPDSGFIGIDRFSYGIVDEYGGEDWAFAMVIVTPVEDDSPADGQENSQPEPAPDLVPPNTNNAPVAGSDDFETVSGETLTGNVLSNDSDADNDKLLVALTSPPEHGSVILNLDGTFSYAPNNGYSGTDTFTYRIVDADGAEAFGTVAIQVTATDLTPADVTPIAEDDFFDADPNFTLFGNVRVNDNDVDAPDYELSYRLVEGIEDGDFNFYGDGSFDYTAEDGATGSREFVYEVIDADGNTGQATAEIRLVAPDPASPSDPDQDADTSGTSSDSDSNMKADVDIVAVASNSEATGSLLLNDEGSAGASVTEFTAANFGSVSVNVDGSYEYVAADGFQGIDYFHYVISDGDTTDRATVILHVNQDGVVPADALQMFAAEMVVSPIVFDLNDDGVINVTGATTARNRPEGISLGRTVEFDIDGDGALNTIEWIDGSGDGILVDSTAIQGTAIDGRALFGDEGGKYENGFAKLRQLDVDGNQLLEEGELTRLRLWVDDGDGVLDLVELETLEQNEIAVVSTRMQLTAEGLMQSWAFTNEETEILTEDVWFGEADAEADTSSTNENNIAPDADPDVVSIDSGATLTGNVLSNDNDPDGDRILVSKYSKPLNGSLSVSDDGQYSYTPDAGFTGVDYFQYEITDGNGGTDVAVVTINVTGGSPTTAPSGGKIDGIVWYDEDGNGLRGVDETVRGTSVFVSLLNEAGEELQNAHTESNGRYQFDGLESGDYRIRIASSSLPTHSGTGSRFTFQDVNSNFFDAVDSDVQQSNGESGAITIAEGGEVVTVDAGYTSA